MYLSHTHAYALQSDLASLSVSIPTTTTSHHVLTTPTTTELRFTVAHLEVVQDDDPPHTLTSSSSDDDNDYGYYNDDDDKGVHDDYSIEIRLLGKCGEAMSSGNLISTRCGTLQTSTHEKRRETFPSGTRTMLVKFSEEVIFPMRTWEIPTDSYLEFTLHSSSASSGSPDPQTQTPHPPPQGTLSIFSPQWNRLRQGRLEIPLVSSNASSSLAAAAAIDSPHTLALEEEEHAWRTSPRLPWLDRLAFSAMGAKRAEEKQNELFSLARPHRRSFYLTVEFPEYVVPVLGTVTLASAPTPSRRSIFNEFPPEPALQSVGAAAAAASASASSSVPASYELAPVEDKYHALRRSQARGGALEGDDGAAAPPLLPNTAERAQIARVLSVPGGHRVRPEDGDLLWKFRRYLTSNGKALPRFLGSVNWSDEAEAAHVGELLSRWADIDIADALQLLSGEPEFAYPAVRAHAVAALAKLPDGVLRMYMLELVQALRYDGGGHATSSSGGKSGSSSGTVIATGSNAGSRPGPLAKLLVARASRNEELGSALHWHLSAEVRGGGGDEAFHVAWRLFKSSSSAAPDAWMRLQAQDAFVGSMMQAVKFANAARGRHTERTLRLRERLRELREGLLLRETPLPLYPSLRVFAVVGEEAKILNSNTFPGVVDLVVGEAGAPPEKRRRFTVMFKEGDDLRQDQLVMQMTEMIDAMYLEVGLDLHITKYRVLATGPGQGLVEFISDCLPLSRVLREHRDVNAFLNARAEAFGGQPAVRARFIASCAGYCVATYVLGVGDRHLDNIMLRSNGELFHVDFGFVFGRDAKSFASPVRLTREMIEGMGGRASPGFQSFRSLCCEAYKCVRAHASLLLSIVKLMSHAGIPDVSVNQIPANVVSGLLDRLQLNLSDHMAELWILDVIDRSVDALGPVLIDYVHEFVQKM